MKGKRLLALIVCFALVCTSLITSTMVVNASAPEGWRNLLDFYVFKDKVGGWSGCGSGELETENSNLPVDTQVTYENLPSLRFNLVTKLTSWMSIIITLADWCCHDVSQYVPNGYLEFNVKGKNGGEQFVIGAVDHVSRRASGTEKTITKPITNYCKVTTQWQHVKIPLKDILDPSLGMDPYNAKAIVLDKVTADPFCVWINQLKFTSPDKEKAYPAIKVNQVGFSESSEKYAYVSGFEDELKAAAGTQFQVKKVSDDTVAYSGQLLLASDYDAVDSGERVFKAVFTDLKQPGDYYITVNADGIDKSPKFKIGNDVFKPILTDAARYFYNQRSGIDLTEQYCPDHPRKDKTPQDVSAVFDSNPSVTRDESKGWFDAGDLGKYVSTGSGSLINLFWSYEMFPEVYSDNQFNIPESGNGVPDILDESRWELEWILKMQDTASGGFYARVQSDDDGNITKRIIKDKEGNTTNIKPTDDTAWAAAALAYASIVYAKYDPTFAQSCLNAAKSA
ncbi:MAG TPA: glycoside hydrolase family 9 protein, partial [Clostridia bacterium]